MTTAQEHYRLMQEAGAREDWDAVERHAQAQLDLEVERLGSLDAVAGVAPVLGARDHPRQETP